MEATNERISTQLAAADQAVNALSRAGQGSLPPGALKDAALAEREALKVRLAELLAARRHSERSARPVVPRELAAATHATDAAKKNASNEQLEAKDAELQRL